MGIWLFQLVIAYIFTDKIVNVFLLLPFGKLHGRANQLFHPRIHCFLMFDNLLFLKQILRNKDKIRRILIVFIPKSCCPENLRMIQTHPKKQVVKHLPVTGRDKEFIFQILHTLQNRMIDVLLFFVKLLKIISFHSYVLL